MSVIIEPKPTMCFHCDFGSGMRGMDSCSKCRGTGSVFRIGQATYPNTKEGYRTAVYALNDPEGEREQKARSCR